MDPAPATPAPATDKPRRSTTIWSALRKRPDPLTSIAFTIPIFLIYHLGVLYVDRRSRVDYVSKWALDMLNASVPAYVMTTLAFTLVLLLTVWVEQRRGALGHSSLGRVLVEALACALFVLMGVGWASHQLLHTNDTQALTSLGPIDKIVLAAGEGFHQELVFRALILNGGTVVLRKLFGVGARVSLLVGIMVSSIASALVHNIGAFGEPFVWQVAAWRVLEGLLFAMLYVARGFAAAVYAHSFYEALVLFVYA